jgi:DNA topoisomerase-1
MSKKTLVIVESPAKGKTIQKYLGTNYVVVPCFGHCVDLAKGGKFGIGVELNNNLKPIYHLMEEKKSAFDSIVNASEGCDKILIASDPDREGEAIGIHLRDRLQSTGLPIKRVMFHEITKTAILAEIANPREFDTKLFAAQQARRILDRVVGFMVSPVLMNIYPEQKLSAGRVQSVAVRMIVDREKEIKAFKPKEFWNVTATLETANKEKFQVKLDEQVGNKADADKVVAELKAGHFVVKSVVRKPKKEAAPPPLTTLMLQQVMSKKFGFSAEQTMTAAQSCYESGYTTYIRTDSVRMGDDAIKSLRTYIQAVGYTLLPKPNVFEAKATAADSHECIRCTNPTTDPKACMLTGDDHDLYDTVWRYSVASQMEPAVYDTLTVTIECGGHELKASGKALSVKGYLEVLGLPKATSIDIPNLTKGDALGQVGVTSEQKFTQPPARYSESNLIKDLDARQIGRPSTMATILKNIMARNYVVKNGNTYHATDLGVEITDLLRKNFTFLNYDYSAAMESNLDKIASGSADYDTVMIDFYKPFSIELKATVEQNKLASCDKCGGLMVERTSVHGKFMACSGCRNIHNIAA